MSQKLKQTLRKGSRQVWWVSFFSIAVFCIVLFSTRQVFSQEITTPPAPIDVNQINAEIDVRRQKINDLQAQIEQYQKGIEAKQSEATTLGNDLLILQGQIAKTELELESLTFSIEEKELEINDLKGRIVEHEKNIDAAQDDLGQLLRALQQLDSRTNLEVLIGNDSFAEFFDQLRYVEQLQGAVAGHVRSLMVSRDELAVEKDQEQARRDELVEIHNRLDATRLAIGEQKQYQANLLSVTKESEEKFSDLLQSALAEQKSADQEIVSLQRQAETIANQNSGTQQGGEETVAPALPENVNLVWPITPIKGISAYFRDPTYIFRKYFEHSAIDIPAPQGTPIAAPADGYVARAKNAGFGYSYIMLIHNDRLATVYGHVSRIDVSEESFVRKGQFIGLTGGLPGTSGAGRFTTGPHLHFEVRVEGIPVNPLDYLP